jgi:hypothetical protein
MQGKRAVYLRFEDGPYVSFIVLSQNPVEVPGDAIRLDQIRVYHFAFWGDDLRERVERLEAARVYRFSFRYRVGSDRPSRISQQKGDIRVFKDPTALFSNSISTYL